MPPSIATCMLATCSAERVIMIFFGSTFDVSRGKGLYIKPIVDDTTVSGILHAFLCSSTPSNIPSVLESKKNVH